MAAPKRSGRLEGHGGRCSTESLEAPPRYLANAALTISDGEQFIHSQIIRVFYYSQTKYSGQTLLFHLFILSRDIKTISCCSSEEAALFIGAFSYMNVESTIDTWAFSNKLLGKEVTM